jgi:hypothetical protein
MTSRRTGALRTGEEYRLPPHPLPARSHRYVHVGRHGQLSCPARGVFGCPGPRQAGGSGGSGRHDGVIGQCTVRGQADALPDLGAGSDARVAANADPVSDLRTGADVHRVADNGVAPNPGIPVNPAAGTDTAAGSDTRPRLDIGRRPDERCRVSCCPAADQTPAVAVTAVRHDATGIVLERFRELFIPFLFPWPHPSNCGHAMTCV